MPNNGIMLGQRKAPAIFQGQHTQGPVAARCLLYRTTRCSLVTCQSFAVYLVDILVLLLAIVHLLVRSEVTA